MPTYIKQGLEWSNYFEEMVPTNGFRRGAGRALDLTHFGQSRSRRLTAIRAHQHRAPETDWSTVGAFLAGAVTGLAVGVAINSAAGSRRKTK